MSDVTNLLKYYLSEIGKFENEYIKDNFENYISYKSPHRGYLINLQSYVDLKNNIKI